MSDREKLVELIKSAKAAMRGKEFNCNLEREYFTAEYLIVHGVTVKEPLKPLQKPMTALEISRQEGLKGKRVYLETKEDGKIVEAAVLRGTPNAWNSFAFDVVGGDRVCAFEYHLNVVYRCWAEKPTDEERMAAAWEK